MKVAAAVPVTLIVTRPEPQAGQWVAALQQHGQPALALPLLRIESDPAFESAVQAAWRDLGERALVMFVSPNAVAQFFAASPLAAWPAGTAAAATGPGTVAALRQVGVAEADIVAPSPDADRFDAETLWEQRLAHVDWQGRKVLIVRGETGRDWLADTLRHAGADLQVLSAYRSVPTPWEAPALHRLAAIEDDPGAYVWHFTSSRAVEHLTTRLPPDARGQAIATHPRIAAAARSAGFSPVIDGRPDLPAVLAALQPGS